MFPQRPMTELADVLKREHKAAEKGHVCFKGFANAEWEGNNDPENRKVKNHCNCMGLN